MAAQNYKIVLFYNQYTQGFTETWYYTGTLAPYSFQSSPWQTMFKAAIKFRGVGVSLVAARYSIIGAPHTAFTVFFGNLYTQPTQGITLPPDISAEDLLIKVSTENAQWKHMYIRGLQQSDTGRNPQTGGPMPSAFLTMNLQAYISAAWNIGLALQVQSTPVSNPAIVKYQVTQVNPTAGVNSTTLTLSAPFVPIGTAPYYVLFHGVPKNDLPGFPKSCQVLAYTSPGGLMTIPYRYRANTTPYDPLKMSVYQLLYTYPVIAQPSYFNQTLQFINFLERKTGKAFFVPRGRVRPAVTRG
jgi:hypothetical protein